MTRPRFKPGVTPDQRLRDLRKEFSGFAREEPGPDRAARLAAFTRAAYQERQLNMAMHAAQLCLDDDPAAPALLLEAFVPGGSSTDDDRLRAYLDLKDLGRYLERPDIVEHAEAQADAAARVWVAEGNAAERRERLRRLANLVSREYAERLRDELGR